MDTVQTLEGFVRAFDAPFPALRRRAMFPFIAMDLVVVQPVGMIRGWLNFIEALDRFAQTHPGYEFRFEIQSPNRFQVERVDGNGTVAGTHAVDATFDVGGRIASLRGFADLNPRANADRLTVHELSPDDAPLYRELRLEALKTDPPAFGAAYETETQWDVDVFRERLTRADMFAGFVAGEPAGLAGLYRLEGPKLCHKGGLFSMYVRPDFRGTGIADTIVAAVVAAAERDQKLTVLQLGVGVYNHPARKLYERHGFVAYGHEPNAVHVDGQMIDEILMWRDVSGAIGQ